MSVPPVTPVPSMSPAEMQILVSRAGLVLNPGQVADLVLAWRQLAGLISRVPHNRKLVDDMAMTFRLAPPANAGSDPRSIPAIRAKAPGKAPRTARAKARAVAGPAKRAAGRTLVKTKSAKRAKPTR